MSGEFRIRQPTGSAQPSAIRPKGTQAKPIHLRNPQAATVPGRTTCLPTRRKLISAESKTNSQAPGCLLFFRNLEPCNPGCHTVDGYVREFHSVHGSSAGSSVRSKIFPREA